LKDFFVYYAIRPDQAYKHSVLQKEGGIPENWRVISDKDLDKGAVVEINGYRFYSFGDAMLLAYKPSVAGPAPLGETT
jgi:hypothetical protein